MGNPKKLHIGQDLPAFPGGTFNQLVAGEVRDAALALTRPQPALSGTEARSPVLVRLHWTGEGDLPIGNVVKLGDVVFEPTTDNIGPVFQGIQLEASAPTADDANAQVAISLGPIKADAIGYGHLLGAIWAKVDVQDSADDSANVVAGTVLESTVGGRFPILWKETGTGEKWAVVLLGSGSSSPAATIGILIVDVPACAVTYTATTPFSKIVPGETADAVIPLRKDGTEFVAKLNEAGDAQTLLRAINPVWPETIFAGTTTNADKPVVVTGYETTWDVGGTDTPAFVITNAIFPVTILKGLCQGAVSGGSFTADNLVTWWGRDPEVSSISSIANPAGLSGDDNAVCVIMQITDGTWVCLGIECP